MTQGQPLEQFMKTLKKGLVRKYFILGLIGLSLLAQFFFTSKLDSIALAMLVFFVADANSEDRLIKALELLKENPAPQPESETVESAAS